MIPGTEAGVHARMARGDRSGATALVMAALATDPKDGDAHHLLGRLLMEEGRLAEAAESFERAVAGGPGSAASHAALGYCAAALGRAAEARESLGRAAAMEADDRTLDMIASAERRLGRHAEARDALERAVRQGSRHPAILFNLATERKFFGDIDGARAALEDAVAIDPDHVKARAALSAVRPATADRNQIADYERLLDRVRDPAVRLHICHAAARECDSIGDHDRAFAFLDAGKRPLRPGDFAAEQALFDALERALARPPAAGGHATAGAPIFVSGMPRSGTTVMERIVAASPAVTSLGETLHVPTALQALAGRRSAHLVDPRDIDQLAARNPADIGRALMQRLETGDGRRPVDKLPLNSLLGGLILPALPDARMICVIRNPMDTILGNYRQLFEYRSAVYRYALSLPMIARFHVGFRRIAALLEHRHPGRFITLSYEELVTDPAAVAGRAFKMAGLAFDPAFLRIEANPGPVATASAIQVREPINDRSIGAWRRHERHLVEARAIVEAAGLAVD